MGRRKIEIKAIKDDRNRSVTFLKRKGGLFKKAHELSVLCSVDVAVIIFGNNKKLFDYSSTDIGEILTRYQYYGGAHEHKGPGDFSGKGKDMDDDDDDDGSVASQHHDSVEPQMMPPHPFPNQPQFHTIRHQTPSASPPIPNGVFQQHHAHPPQRQHTPQPQPHPGSRPSSRNAPRRQGSNLVPPQQQPQQHPQPPNGYAYMPNPAIYNPHNQPPGPPHPHGLPPHMQGPPIQGPQGMPQQGPGPQYQNYPPPPPPQQQQQQQQQQQPQPQPHPHPQQVQQIYMEEQRRASVPPAFPQQQERPSSRPNVSPPQPQPQQVPPQQQQQQQQQQHQEQQQPQVKLEQPPPEPQEHEPEQQNHGPQQQQQQMLEPVKRLSVKSRSIFTPIDESRSILSQHWASSTSNTEPRSEPALAPGSGNPNRSQSVDVGAVSRVNPNNSPPQPVRANTHGKNRVSVSSMPDGLTPPSRSNSAQLGAAKRPILQLQIPEENSEDEGGTGNSNSSPRSSTHAPGSHPRQNGHDAHASGVVLPPPSPSASALLSAGASGPPNPFARPHPVSQPSQNSNASGGNMIDTPVSALPSRFMTNEFLPSPSSFYPEWNFRGSDSNTLPSPLNFATPVVGTGPSFLREDSGDRQANTSGNGKRKTPEAEGSSDGGGGDAKRAKHDA